MRRKVFSFAKKTAEIFRNKNYFIYLVDKNKDKSLEIKNNLSSKTINIDNEGLKNY